METLGIALAVSTMVPFRELFSNDTAALGGALFLQTIFLSFFGVILRLLFIRSNAVSGCQRVSDCLLGAIPEHNLHFTCNYVYACDDVS